MLVGFYGLWHMQVELLLLVVFAMGLHSTIFGPVKYSMLPELLRVEELVGGTALVEAGTFVAIPLAAALASGIAKDPNAPLYVGAGTCIVAVLGLVASVFVPKVPAQAPDLRIDRNPFTPSVDAMRIIKRQPAVLNAVFGISWFTFIAYALLTFVPIFTKDKLFADEHVVGLFMVTFPVGIAVGAVLCERLSHKRLELGLVPFGTIGMTWFVLDLYFAANSHEWPTSGEHLGIGEFLSTFAGCRIVFDLALLAVFSGFFTVPLYTLMQQRSEPTQRSRVIAGNNILNAFFGTFSMLFLLGASAVKLPLVYMFLILSILNGVVSLYIYKLVPEFLFRFAAWVVASLMYRMRIIRGIDLPHEGPCVIVANHVSFVDWLLIASAVKTPVRFVMYHGFMKLPVLGFLFRDAKVIPIAPAKEDPNAMEAAFDRIAAELEAGEIVCIFPEGELTKTGEMGPFKSGIERVIARTPVPVIPLGIKGMWGSFFSRKDGDALKKPFRRLWSRVDLIVGDAVPASEATAAKLESVVRALVQ
jgi:1-acyl-sn-glycerol-3-phosphate acyltransferase